VNYLWKKVLFRSALIAVVAASTNFGFTQKRQHTVRKPDVPFVVSVDEVVDMMLKTADVTDKDKVYDLGCGDGRIVIAAASKYGARGVGVDINPTHIKESRRNAQKAGVSRKVTFIEQDLLKTDLSQATVVAIYLDPKMNLRLRPKLLRELKPGARVVSNSFDMGDWKPDKVVKLTVAGSECIIYYWTIEPQRKSSLCSADHQYREGLTRCQNVSYAFRYITDPYQVNIPQESDLTSLYPFSY
jgi:SAM-dependent methyltransferase